MVQNFSFKPKAPKCSGPDEHLGAFGLVIQKDKMFCRSQYYSFDARVLQYKSKDWPLRSDFETKGHTKEIGLNFIAARCRVLKLVM